jgi:hypothetical protein
MRGNLNSIIGSASYFYMGYLERIIGKNSNKKNQF